MKIATILGARPQFIKAAPLSAAFAKRGDFQETIIHSSQHFDDNMSSIFFQELGVPKPSVNLNVRESTHGGMTGVMLAKIERALEELRPDFTLVFGDTNTTLAGALAAVKLGIPVAHVEAGLRSFDFYQPEEVNRRVTDHGSRLLFCPTERAVELLAAEGVREGVHFTGDVMYDAALMFRKRAPAMEALRSRIFLPAGSYAVATVHRPENTDAPDRLREVMDYLKSCADSTPVVLPVHPRTRKACERFDIDFDGLWTTDPLGHLNMTALVANAEMVVTDSGGLQKEAFFHNVPCITMRGATGWPETIEVGWNRLWRSADYGPRKSDVPFGDGDACGRIVETLAASV